MLKSFVLSTLLNPTSDFKIPVGELIIGLINVLFVKLSIPLIVAKIPDRGKVILVAPIVFKVVLLFPKTKKSFVVENRPPVVKFPLV